MEAQIQHILQEIGLTDGEQKVYTALLELGETTSGPIAEKSGVSASKVYQVLDRLMKKSLVGEVTRDGTKHFKAMHPNSILDYLKQEVAQLTTLQDQATNILPSLIALFEDTKQETEVQLYRGMKGLRSAFYNMVDELQGGGEYLVLGANAGIQGIPQVLNFFNHYHTHRAEHQVHVRFLFQDRAQQIGDERFSEAKFLPPDFHSPLQVNIYNDKTVFLLMEQDPVVFLITSQPIADSFRQYFEQLWNQDTLVVKGRQGVETILQLFYESSDDVHLIGAHGLLEVRYPDLYKEWEDFRKKNGLKRINLCQERVRGTPFASAPLTETKFLEDKFFNPLVIWIYGDIVVQALWEESETFFIIKNKVVAQHFRRYYRLLEKIAVQ